MNTPSPVDVIARAPSAPVRGPVCGHHVQATLHLSIDPVEHRRREAAGLREITDYSLLDTLFGLPVGEPVPLDALTGREREDVGQAPHGVLDISGGCVTRLAVRPCRVELATVRGTCTRKTLARASQFAPFCTRAVITTVRPTAPEELIEFHYWGIGVIHEDPDGAREVLVEPQPWRPQRVTPAGWRFAENAYGSWLDAGGTP